jgi:transposase-like protein
VNGCAPGKVKEVAAVLKAIHAQEYAKAVCVTKARWMMWEIRRRTRVMGAFPDGQSALMLVAIRLRRLNPLSKTL